MCKSFKLSLMICQSFKLIRLIRGPPTSSLFFFEGCSLFMGVSRSLLCFRKLIWFEFYVMSQGVFCVYEHRIKYCARGVSRHVFIVVCIYI
jgi:hypothetical protein